MRTSKSLSARTTAVLTVVTRKKVSNGLMFSFLGTKQKLIRAPDPRYARFVFTLPTAAIIMVVQSGSLVDTSTAQNLELEYETIQSREITSEVLQVLRTACSLSNKHATLMKTVEWDKSLTLINEINLPRSQ